MNSNYWEHEGATKTFTHTLSQEWIESIASDTRVLDFGCGYGRITKQLHGLGFEHVLGYDPSKAMISRALSENPGPVYTCRIEDVLEQRYGLVICFALFTSCPCPAHQAEIKKILEKQTDTASRLYISDYLMSENRHYAAKYAQRRLGIYGCFRSETTLFRHHEDDHFSRLFPGWTLVSAKTNAGKTLNGNRINISQQLFKKD